ncbi:MAG: GGDEF domain-containing protein [Pseudomonadota bacterium]
MRKRTGHRRVAETIRFSADEVQTFAKAANRHATLLVVQGADVDIGTHVVCDRPITLGRDPDVELPLRDGSISRRHCRVAREGEDGPYLLSDLGSTNGTRVNGSPIAQPVALAESDKVFLGTTVVRFTFADELDVEYHTRLETMVTTDPLTGLMSKRRFDGEYSVAVQKARAEGIPISVLVMDMDGLKQINDTHGHEMGGYAIIEAAGVIRTVVDERGFACRFGGDEFMAFLPGYDKQTAFQIAEEIRDGIATHRFEKASIRVEPTISLGVSTLPEDGETTDDLFRAADRALYRAKAGGKNRVAI